MKRNPKLAGSNLYDCRPQTGLCPNGCNQCFYNHHYYEDINKPRFPNPPKGGIVRVNCGHDSNIQKDLVIDSTARYEHKFFNTSIPNFDFPGPVVWTANPEEEKRIKIPRLPDNVMFVRLRVSMSNLSFVEEAVLELKVPVVLTFMRYYKDFAKNSPSLQAYDLWKENYVYKEHLVNSYWCPTDSFIYKVYKMMYGRNRLVSICGKLCKDCRNCETYYWQCQNRLFNLENALFPWQRSIMLKETT